MSGGGLALLDELRDTFRRLETLPADAAKLAAPLVERALKATASAGTTPDGQAWPAKKDGGAPLVHAADAIKTEAVGTVVRTTLTGPTVFHHFGAGSPRRQVIPDPGSIPAGVERALKTAADLAFDRAVGR